MNTVNRITVITFIVLSNLITIFSVNAAEQVVGKTFYTTANLWFDKNESDMMNYHKGAILPVGTKIKVKEILDGAAQFEHNALYTPVETGGLALPLRDYFIRFDDENGKSYKIIFRSQRTKGRSTIVWDFFNKHFSPDDPMAKKGAFRLLTTEEQKHVMAGEIAPGMSKEAVMMAYGFPPAHRTPLLQSNKWVYLENHFKKRVVLFSDGKVVEKEALQGKKKRLSSIDNCINACRKNTSHTPEECFDACNH